ncbi:DUF3991 and TOPRIM domain-containing protein [[Clostridium] colinum]|uniref:DUF3991 and TOPRIM domain-containing protein n=1 Tax=[Clostridium] colinum TaxID=36835 RepID=UPI002024A9B9|nr:DUF3991 and TOPRIM domain-containing protein [[Clostridium] colinum]
MAGFTQEEYEKASQVELLDYLISNGYKLKKVGTNEYTLEEHDSMRINPLKNTFFWNSRNVGGSTIQFLQYYEGKTLVETIKTLNGKSITSYINSSNKGKVSKEVLKEEKGDLILPEKNEDNKRAIAYLTQTRKIDIEIVNSLIKSGNIYESKDKHNIVFLGMDKDNVPKYAMKRSTLTNSNYKGDCKNSDKEFGFRINGKSNSDRVYVFEGVIDLLTHASISKHLGGNWRDANRVSLGCLSFKSMDNFLQDNKNIKEIVLFLDNDKSGIRDRNKLYRHYGNDYKIEIVNVKNKDLNQTWQDYLKDKEVDKNIKFNNYIKYVDDKPFLVPKVLENQDNIRNYTINMMIDNNNMKFLFRNDRLVETQDNKAILLIKNEKDENIGGYEWDIYNKEYSNLTLLDKSVEKPLIFKALDNKSDSVFLYNDIVSPLYMMKKVNTGYTNHIENLDNIDCIINDNKNLESIFLCVDPNTEFYKQAKDKNSLIYKQLKNKEENYNIKIGVEEWNKDNYKEFLKDDYIKSSFITKEKGDNEELYSFLLRKTNIPKQKLVQMFKYNHIYQDVDRNMVFLVKNEDGKNIGGYSLDIYNKSPQLKRLENTYIPKEQEDKIINFATYIYKNINSSLEIEQVEEMEI